MNLMFLVVRHKQNIENLDLGKKKNENWITNAHVAF